MKKRLIKRKATIVQIFHAQCQLTCLTWGLYGWAIITLIR